MPFHIFVCHSTSERVVEELLRCLTTGDIVATVADRELKFGDSLSTKTEKSLREADAVLAILTREGAAGSYVNQEVGIANAVGTPVIAIAEAGMDINSVQIAEDYIKLDLGEPAPWANALQARLRKLPVANDAQNAIWFAVVCAARELRW